MIRLTRFNRSEFLLSSDDILTIESHPDTTITLRSGEKYVVRETPDEILDRIVSFHARIRAEAARLEREAPPAAG